MTRMIPAGTAPRMVIPMPLVLPRRAAQVLACGGERSNTICLTRSHRAYMSRPHGDPQDCRSLPVLGSAVEYLRQTLRIIPEIIAHDLDTDIVSTCYALLQPVRPLIGVQHHHAHIAACLAEQRIAGPVLGVIMDGSGLGTDGREWGGEILVADTAGFHRAAHVEYVAMPGNGSIEPWHAAVSFLFHSFGPAFVQYSMPMYRDLNDGYIWAAAAMLEQNVQVKRTSAVERMFDAVAALIGIHYMNICTGESVKLLEMIARERSPKPYEYDLSDGDPIRIRIGPMIQGIVGDIQRRMTPSEISSRFHATLVRFMADVCERLAKINGLRRIVLSGSLFDNRVLLGGLWTELENRGMTVYSHRLVPCNDQGLSLGQAVVAAAVEKGDSKAFARSNHVIGCKGAWLSSSE